MQDISGKTWNVTVTLDNGTALLGNTSPIQSYKKTREKNQPWPEAEAVFDYPLKEQEETVQA